MLYILDTALNLVPVGIPGELYIGGAGLARGYLNRPELTAERFISTEHSILYRTGDRAQYYTDGTIEFLGRMDTQIKIRGFRVELGEIEATLQRHPAIQDAVAITSEGSSNDKRLIAYFSLDRQHLQQVILHLQTQQVQHWQTLYNQTYQSTDRHQSSAINDQPFNITGWNSSYTGEPIPSEQMHEWVSDRVQQILVLKPQRVLEIGCGTGLLLFQIAPYCQEYVGTDFSTVSLESIQHQLEPKLPQVKLLHRMATDFQGIGDAFDVVILNSIVQYFPSQDYLIQVLESAVQAVAPGGVLFLGDVRSLPLLTAFHTWVQFYQAAVGTERTQLRQQVERSRFEEPELAIDPAFFQTLRDRFPQIQQVQIRLSRGRSQNEMVQFRYNVLLYVENKITATNKPSFHSVHLDWKSNQVTIAEIQKQLCETQPEIVVVMNVRNSRVNAATRTVDWLFSEATPKTVGRMREVLRGSTEMAIDPQDWWDLETVLPYKVEVTWSTQTQTGEYDVVLTRHGVDATVDLSIAQQQRQPDRHTNNPLQSLFVRQLIPELRQYLGQTLPDYMIPSAFVPLEALPLTHSGKVNRRALPTLNADFVYPSAKTAIGSPNTETAPQTQIELTLTNIWKELLRLKQVNAYDNFFELGGHSLLATQMTSRVRDAFGLELPLKSVFESPTIAQLAPVIDTLRRSTSTRQAPPIVRLDRAAHRRVRPSHNSYSPQASLQFNSPITPPAEVVKAWSPLVPLTIGSHKQPFFCVHPMFGVVLPYLELAHHLGSEHSFYGLQPLGLDGKHLPLNQIEAIAAYYIQAIQTIQPQGPYLLSGWSFGGLVAFEMAQQLTQAGQQIELLAILDTPAPLVNNQLSLSQSLKFLLGTALWSTLPFLLDYGAIATSRSQPLPPWKAWFSRWQWSAIARLVPEESRLRLLDESAIAPMLRIVYANSQAAYRYVPQSYPNRVTLFKAAEQPSDSIEQSPTLGWDRLANEVQLHQVPGNHLSLLKQPHVQTLAEQLRQYLP